MRQSVFSFLSESIAFGVILLTSLLGCPAQAAEFSGQLEETLSAKNAADFVSVLVFMTDRVDVTSLQQRYKLTSFTRQASHQIMVTQLQSFAQANQAGFVSELDAAEERGDVRSYETYWITNAMQIEAKRSYIESLRSRRDIAAIVEDLPMQSLYSPPIASTATQVTDGVSPGLRAIHADSMWALGYTGTGSLIASFDTGVNPEHPALHDSYHALHGYPAAACWFDPVYRQAYPHYESTLSSGGHGTATMGVMVGKDDSSGDTVGVAFGADWISAMVVDIPGANYLEAFQWIADPDGDPNTVDDVPDVLNNSWGFTQGSIGCLDIFWEPIDNVEAAGCVVVFSCGNSGPNPRTLRNPANRATTPFNTFSVGAVYASEVNTIWNGSSRGPSDCDTTAIKPEVVAPGYQVKTTSANLVYPYVMADGTSFAGPHVAGAVALLRQYNPNAPVDSIKSALMRSAADKGAPGEDNTFGWGVIDIPAAMSLLAPNNQINIYVQQTAHAPIKPGDTVDVIVQLRNSGLGTVGVSGLLANPQAGASILLGYSYFGDMGMNVSKNNGSNPYRLVFGSSLAEGARLTVDLQISDGSSYLKTAKLYFTVGTALVKSSYTHQSDSIKFTVSNYGTYGLAPESVSNKGGAGFAYPTGGSNNLFQCGLMIGTDSTHVSDGVVNRIKGVDEDFAIALGGNLTVAVGGGVIGDIETVSRFCDDHAANPLGLVVEQRTATFNGASESRYIIMEYVLTNKSAVPINNAYAGIYADWDFPWGAYAGGQDRTNFSREYGLGYLYQGVGSVSYRGTAVLNPEGVRTFYAIPNFNIVYDNAGNGLVDDARKFDFLSHGLEDTTNLGALDQSYCIATGPFNLAPGESDTACFVMVAGANLAALQSAVASARAKYRVATPVDDGNEVHLPSAFELRQNFPNPFNPETVISYSLERTSLVTLSIFNLLGQEITTLIDENQTAGIHSVTWNGRDQADRPVASGVYFYRLKTGNFAETKKMVLLK